MSNSDSSHTPLKLVMKFALNVALVFVMSNYVGQYFGLDGGIPAYVIVGALITLLNIFVRPILAILTAPLRLFASIIAIVIVNGIFVYLVHMITINMDPELVKLTVTGGPVGWVVVAICFGLSNWVMKEMFK